MDTAELARLSAFCQQKLVCRPTVPPRGQGCRRVDLRRCSVVADRAQALGLCCVPLGETGLTGADVR
jgi:hypothetical protein